MMEWLFILILMFSVLGLIAIVVEKILEFKDNVITKASDVQKIPKSTTMASTQLGFTKSMSLDLIERCKNLKAVIFAQSSYEQTSAPAVIALVNHGVSQVICDEQAQKYRQRGAPAVAEKYMALRERGIPFVEMGKYVPIYVTPPECAVIEGNPSVLLLFRERRVREWKEYAQKLE